MKYNGNGHIVDYLKYYISLDIVPGYAVLIRGKWGSGKSWFIKNFIKDNTSNQYLYVSLYGVTTFKDIEDSFFQQLHPILASKGMQLAGKILKGILKTTIKVDLDGDKKEEGSVSSGVPDVNIPDYLKNIDNKILVFDDLERCSVPVPSILGYINQFVESHGLKVIIIANEEEIIKQDEKDKNTDSTRSYLTIKEKLIGKSFEVHSDFDAAYDEFVNEINRHNIKDFFEKNKCKIKKIYNLAGYQNLRHLRQSLLDFERFDTLLPVIAKNKEKLLNHILELFFSISFEIKKGQITEEELAQLFLIDFIIANKSLENKTNAQIVRSKYPIYNEYYHPLDYSVFTPFFKLGTVDKDLIENSVKSSIYFKDERTPDWIKLWYYFDLDDNSFEKVLGTVYNEFINKQILNKYELLQITGILVLLSSQKLFSVPKNEIIRIAKENIDHLDEIGQLKIYKNEDFPSDNSHSLSYQGLKIADYQGFLKYARDKAKNSDISGYPQIAKELLDLMNTSLDQFEEKLTISNSSNNLYYDTPILIHIPVQDFISSFFRLSNKDKKELGWILEGRYKYPDFAYKLKKEFSWLKSVRTGIKRANEANKGKISGYITEQGFLKSLNKCIDILSIYNQKKKTT